MKKQPLKDHHQRFLIMMMFIYIRIFIAIFFPLFMTSTMKQYIYGKSQLKKFFALIIKSHVTLYNLLNILILKKIYIISVWHQIFF